MNRIVHFVIFLVLLTSCSTLPIQTENTDATSLPAIATQMETLMPEGILPDLQVITHANANQVHLSHTFEIPDYMRGKISQCNPTFSPDGNLLASACGGNAVPVWDIQTGELVYSLDTNKQQMVTCTFSPDGTILACGGFDGKETFWDAATGLVIKDIAVINSPVWDAAFSPDGKTLATCGISDGVRLWDVTSGEQVWVTDAVSKCLSLAFDPTGSVIAFGSLEGTAGVLDAVDGKAVGTMIELGEPIGDITFNHQGSRLAAACDDNKAYLWQTGDLKTLADYVLETDLPGHKNFVNGIAFSLDDSLLISNSHDKSTLLWDLINMNLRGALKEHTQVVLRGVINPQGTLIATVSWDGTVKLFGVEK